MRVQLVSPHNFGLVGANKGWPPEAEGGSGKAGRLCLFAARVHAFYAIRKYCACYAYGCQLERHGCHSEDVYGLRGPHGRGQPFESRKRSPGYPRRNPDLRHFLTPVPDRVNSCGCGKQLRLPRFHSYFMFGQ